MQKDDPKRRPRDTSEENVPASAPKPALRLLLGGRGLDEGARSDDEPPSEKAIADEELIDGVRRGRAAAADALFRRYATPVWRTLVWVLGDDPELEDIHQEVFIQALRSAHRFRHDAPLQSWLCAIAINCARSRLRYRRRRRWLSFVVDDALPEASFDPNDPTACRVRAVYLILDRLDPDSRIAFSLRFIEGLSLGEIADVTGVSLGTVKRRLRRGRDRFTRLASQDPDLQPLCPEPSHE